MSLKERIQEDVKDAMRAKDKPRLATIRLITAAIKQVADTRVGDTIADERNKDVEPPAGMVPSEHASLSGVRSVQPAVSLT